MSKEAKELRAQGAISVRTMTVGEIKPYLNNPRKNEEAVEAVMASIKRNGYLDPIEVDETGVILSGHTRYKALIRLKWTQIPVIMVTGLSEEQKIEYRILANRTGEVAKWDDQRVIAEFRKLTSVDDLIDAFPDLSLDKWATKFDQEERKDLEKAQKDLESGMGQPVPADRFKTAACPNCGHEFQVS